MSSKDKWWLARMRQPPWMGKKIKGDSKGHKLRFRNSDFQISQIIPVQFKSAISQLYQPSPTIWFSNRADLEFTIRALTTTWPCHEEFSSGASIYHICSVALARRSSPDQWRCQDDLETKLFLIWTREARFWKQIRIIMKLFCFKLCQIIESSICN